MWGMSRSSFHESFRHWGRMSRSGISLALVFICTTVFMFLTFSGIVGIASENRRRASGSSDERAW